jgi:aryl-alcohol dehydrogenase-like predicted oxidoreductase
VEPRPLGSTELTVTPIGLGLAARGRPSYINVGHAEDLGGDRSVDALERRAHELLDAAVAAGVRYLDAARSYGRAEAFLASWLAARSNSDPPFTVGSKWGYTYTAGWDADAEVHEVKDHSVATLRRQLAESRALLGERLDLYQIHSATLETGVLDDPEVLAELVALGEAGVVVGLSVSGPRQADVIRRALDAAVDGVNPFRCVQATWNLLEPAAGSALAEAAGAGWGVIAKEGVANGRLTPRNSDVAVREPLDAVASRSGVTADAVALASVLAQSWASVALSGASTLPQLHSNLAAADVALSPADLDALAGLAEPSQQYWTTRSGLAWN